MIVPERVKTAVDDIWGDRSSFDIDAVPDGLESIRISRRGINGVGFYFVYQTQATQTVRRDKRHFIHPSCVIVSHDVSSILPLVVDNN